MLSRSEESRKIKELLYSMMNIANSIMSILFVKYLWSPILFVKILTGTILVIKTLCLLNIYNWFEDADSKYVPIITLGDLVNGPKFAKQKLEHVS